MASKSGGVLTAKGLAAMAPGEWSADPAARGAGRLQARKLEGGQVAWYYRYTMSDGRRDRMPLGTGLSLAEARDRAAALSRRYQAGDRDLRASIEAERASVEAAARAAQTAANARAEASLRSLMDSYVEALEAEGKVSAKNVRNAVKLHLLEAWPALVERPADDIELPDFLPVLSRLVSSGKRREAGKLRSYIRAAYAAAIRAQQDPTAPDALRALNIAKNPARDLATIDGSNNARKRVLSIAELRAYWRRISGIGGSALLKFHLLTGGQRINQLARLTEGDFDMDAGVVVLMDGKGRRKQPRAHAVPVIEPASSALQEMRGRRLGPHLFTVTEGAAPATYDQFRGRLDEVVASMLAAGELERDQRFTPGDLRRTIETRLAAMGESDEARAQLQSHGLGGVQNRHYNLHQYADEKRNALLKLFDLVSGELASVSPIRRKQAG